MSPEQVASTPGTASTPRTVAPVDDEAEGVAGRATVTTTTTRIGGDEVRATSVTATSTSEPAVVVESGSWPSSRPARIMAVTVVAGTAAFLRLWDLGRVGFNTDEAVYAGQAASIAGDEVLSPFFPIFRAHPLLFQTLLSVVYLNGTSDLAGRVLAASFGIGTVLLAYAIGVRMYGRVAGLAAAAFLAVMPYHVVVSRQVLLDGPLTFFSAVTVYLLVRYADSGRRSWLYAAGGALGLTFLSKEIAGIWIPAMYAFFALAPQVKVRLRDLFLASLAFLVVALPFPLSLVFAGRSDTGQSFLQWQLFRRPNHPWSFYFTEVPPAMGWAVVVLAIAGVVVLRRHRSWRETLLLCWIAVPLVFFLLWPVKGFQYLLPISVPVSLLAGRALGALGERRGADGGRRKLVRLAVPVLGLAVVVSLAVPTVERIRPSSSGTFLAGSGGVPGGREAGEWVGANVPEGAELLALGPSMANVIQFYGHRRTYGLSVSSNPLHRNPTYTPVRNPDLQIRRSELQYLVWDAYSADRSPFFSERLLRYADRYHGRAIHTETVEVEGDDGQVVERPVIVIYEVRP